MATARTYKARLERIRTKGLRWEALVQQMSYIERSDGRKLALSVAWIGDTQKYIAGAVEAGDVDTPEAIFADHGHQNLGTFPTELEAKQACRAYSLHWLEHDGKVDSCDCEPIESDSAAE